MIRNLGQVAAIYIGSSAPRNTNLIWLDNTVVPFVFRAYDGSAWSEIATHKWVRAYVDGWLVTLPPRQLADDGDYMLINSNNVNYKITVKDFVKSAVGNPLDFKGVIRVSADFPNPSTLESGDMYVIITSPAGGTVTDPYSGKTFEDSEKIVWDEVTQSWESLGKIDITVDLTTSYSETEVTIHSSAGKETTIQGATDQLAGVMLPGQYSWLQALSNGSIVPGDPSPLTPLTPAHKHNYNDIINRLVSQQGTGESTIDPMSQKATTDALNLKFDKASVLQVSGAATDKVMSQKAVTDALKTLSDDFNNKLTNYLPLAGGTMKGSIRFPAESGIIGNADGTGDTYILRSFNNRLDIGSAALSTRIISNASDLLHHRSDTSYKIWDAYNLPDPATLSGNNVFTGNNTFQAGKFNVGPFEVTSSGSLLSNINTPAGSAWSRSLVFRANNDIPSSLVFGGYNSVDNTSIGYAYIGIGDVNHSTAQYKFYSNQFSVSSTMVVPESSFRIFTGNMTLLYYNKSNKNVQLGPSNSGMSLELLAQNLYHTKYDSASSTWKNYTIYSEYNLPNPATSTDLANYLPLAGGTLTGQVIFDSYGLAFNNITWSNDLVPNRSYGGYLQVLDAYDANNAGGPTNYGTVLQVNSRNAHWANQLWFPGGAEASKKGLYYRHMPYNSTTYGEWIKLATTSDLGNYLPLSGGTISSSKSNPLTINSTHASQSSIDFSRGGVNKGTVGFYESLGSFLQNVTGETLAVKSDGAYYGVNIDSLRKLATVTDLNNYLPLTGGALSGTLTIDTIGSNPFVINNNDTNGSETFMRVLRKGTASAAIGFRDSLGAYIYNYNSNKYLFIDNDGYARVGTTSGNTRLALITDIPTVSGYLPLTGGTLTGTLSINSGGSEPLIINNSASAGEAYVVTKTQGTTRGVMGWNSSLGMFLQDNRGYTFSVKADGVYFGASSSTLTKLLTSADLSSYATQSWANGQFASLALYNTTRSYSTIRTIGNEICIGNTAATSAFNQILVNYRVPSGCTYAPASWVWRAGSSSSYAVGYWGDLYMNDNLVATQSWSNSQYPLKTGTGASGTWGISITGNATTATTASKLGSTTIGGSAKPIYLSSGTPTACSATVGSATVPVYMNAGTITQCSTTLGVSITGNAATATNATQLGGTAASSYVKANDNISRLTNDSGFITSSALNGYATQAWVNSQNFVKSTSTKKVTDIQPVDALPATQASGVLYLVFG